MGFPETFQGITVYGLYNDQTGDALYGVIGAPVPASAIYVGGKDINGNLVPLSFGSNGYLNTNASITPPSDNTATGTLITPGATLAVSTQGTSALFVQITGTITTGTVEFQVSLDGTTWQSAQLFTIPTVGGQEASPSVASTTAPGNWTLPVGGIQKFQVITSGGFSGSVVVNITAGQGQYSVFNYSDNQANFLATVYQPTAANLNATVVQGTTPWVDDISQFAGVAIGAATVVAFGAAVGAGNVQAVNSSIYAGTTALTATGSSLNVNITGTTGGTLSVTGTLTNDNAAPIADNLGVLPALVTVEGGTAYTAGFQALLTVTTTGALRDDMYSVAGVPIGPTSVVAFGTAPAAVLVQAVNSSIFSGTTSLTNTAGALNINIASSSVTDPAEGIPGNPVPGYAIQIGGSDGTDLRAIHTDTLGDVYILGTLTNNAAAPVANNLGVLPAIAGTEAGQTYTSGDQVLLTTTLTGALRDDMYSVAGVALGPTAVTNFGTAPAAAAVQGVNASIYAGTTGLTATGSSLNVNVTGTTGTVTVAGNLSNNTAAPIADNVGVLGFIANGTTPGTPPPTPLTYTNGYQVLPVTTLAGSQVVMPADEYYAGQISYYGADNDNVYKTISNNALTPTAIVSIQTQSTTVNYQLREWQGFTSGTVCRFHILKNPTLTGTTYATTRGNMKIDTAGTYTPGTGTVIASGYGAAGTGFFDNQLNQYIAAGATGDVFTIVAIAFGSGTGSAVGMFKWSEEIVSI